MIRLHQTNHTQQATYMITGAKKFVVAICAGAIGLVSLSAGSNLSKSLNTTYVDDVKPNYESNFDALSWEFKVEAGGFHQIMTREFQPETLNYATANVLWGMMLYSPTGPGILRGNTEFFMGINGGGFANGPGTYIAPGIMLALQYNFVQPGSRWVPIIGVNAGTVFVDPKLRTDYVGSSFNFTWSPYVGLRCFLNEKWSLQATFNYNHMSNADTTSNNHGIDGLGGMLGISYFFK
ncbi:acyloxyacyl hydrolase [Oscillatoria amoena NRMC-F 0135]|nr:acyloxyacyl hydrolase [Oscillatoria laete-virens]MDL5048165.1 acyloxyacyl hydrolase [Oscillatoria amoena NRMC-F 0135]MDL5053057.1 acyloxyacyl hydrolase [Oscillatoria laete-virens NRMC-F 0139]